MAQGPRETNYLLLLFIIMIIIIIAMVHKLSEQADRSVAVTCVTDWGESFPVASQSPHIIQSRHGARESPAATKQ